MLKIRHILFLLCALTVSVSVWGLTSTVDGTALKNAFVKSTRSTSWSNGAGEQKVTFALRGTDTYFYTTPGLLGSLYFACGLTEEGLFGVIIPLASTYQTTYLTLSWQVHPDFDIEVTKVTMRVGRGSGENSYIKVGDGEPVGDLFNTLFSTDISSGTTVYTTAESVPIVFEKAFSWSTVTVDRIEITYNLIPKFIFHGKGSGGASEQIKWEKTDNWLPGRLPSDGDDVFIRHDVVVSGKGEAKSVTIEGANKVTVAPTGSLKVGDGGINNAMPDNFKLQAGTTGTSKGRTGALLIDPDCATMPNATVELYSKAYFDMRAEERNNVGSYQYVGSPMKAADVAAKTVFANSWVYSWDESSGEWKNKRKTLTLAPFVGYATSQYLDPEGILIEHTGELAKNENVDLPLKCMGSSAELRGINVLANSYAAPIDITRFVDGDFSTGVEATIYLFNTGSKNDVAACEEQTAINLAAPGQFIHIPVNMAADLVSHFDYPAVIPSMQGFYVKTNNDGSTLTLDYKRLVWEATNGNAPLRAKRADEQKKGSLCVTIEADGWRDQVFLLESEEYDAAFENGYDAHKLMQGNLNIFSMEGGDALAVDATNSIIGTRIGVRTGEETAYTLTFGSVNGETEWSLFDVETKETIDIEEGMQYTFFAEPNSLLTDRFYIAERNDAPAITTDLDEVNTGVASHKFIKDGQLFVMKNGLIYNTLGVAVSR